VLKRYLAHRKQHHNTGYLGEAPLARARLAREHEQLPQPAPARARPHLHRAPLIRKRPRSRGRRSQTVGADCLSVCHPRDTGLLAREHEQLTQPAPARVRPHLHRGTARIRASENAHPPWITIGPYVNACCRVLGGVEVSYGRGTPATGTAHFAFERTPTVPAGNAGYETQVNIR
jgi:hypothetical protein